MRVLVFGGREYSDRKRIAAVLSELKPTVLIQGGCRGADCLAADWARATGVPVESYPADWAKYGKAAGPIRNKQMLDEGKPDVAVGFPGGRGTLNMATQADEAGVKVILVDEYGR